MVVPVDIEDRERPADDEDEGGNRISRAARRAGRAVGRAVNRLRRRRNRR